MTTIGSNIRPGQPLAVVVGAGGLSTTIARRLGDVHRLLICDLDAALVERTVSALHAEGHDVRGQMCDVTSEPSVRALAAEAAGSARSRRCCTWWASRRAWRTLPPFSG